MAQTDQDVLSSGEAFVVGMLQALSGSAFVVGIAQARALIHLSGHLAYRAFVTAMAAALVTAVLAAYWTHQHRVWDVKAKVSSAEGDAEATAGRSKQAGWYLAATRRASGFAVILFAGGIGFLIVNMWVKAR